MKSIVKVRFMRCFVLIALLLYLAPLQAQSIIYDDSLQLAEMSIIRNYTDNVDITHSVPLGINNCFNYIDRASLYVIPAEITAPIAVDDFVIMGDTVFFCGSYHTSGVSNKAVYGFFDINDVFFYGGSIKYWTLNTTIAGHPDYYRINALNKIAVTKTALGEIHLFMTGSGCNFSGVTTDKDDRYIYYPGVIADVLIDAYGNHNCLYYIDDDDNFRFDDVEITDGFGVVTARHLPNNPYCNYRVFRYTKPVSTGSNFFGTSPTGGIVYANYLEANPEILTVPQFDKVRIIKMEQDTFATVCHKYDPNSTYYPLTLSIYQHPSHPPIYRYVIPEYGECLDLVYNQSLKYLYIALGLKYVLGIKSPFATTTFISTIADGFVWMSVDNADSDTHETLSGFEYSTLKKKLWRLDDVNPNSCVTYSNVQNTASAIDDINRENMQTITCCNPQGLSFVPKAEPIRISKICED